MTEDLGYRRFGYQPLQSQSGQDSAGMQSQQHDAFGQGHGAGQPGLDGSGRFAFSGTGRKNMTAYFKSPLALTAAVLLGGTVFAGVIMSSYPSSDGVEAVVPVIKADASDYKVRPSEEGGMDIPFRDSTVFDSMRSAEYDTEGSVENLLAESDGSVDDGTLSVEAEEEMVMVSSEPEIIDITDKLQKRAEGVDVTSKVASAKVVTKPAEDTHSGAVENLIAEPIEKAPVRVSEVPVQKPVDVDVTGVVEKVVEETVVAEAETSSVDDAPVLKKIRPAGSSPETLAFVRSVLEKKDDKVIHEQVARADSKQAAGMHIERSAPAPKAVSPAPSKVAAVAPVTKPVVSDAARLAQLAPAAGAGMSVDAAMGTHFVQLASVSNAAAAASEWPKLQAKYSVLSGTNFRVQQADLGARGVFHRIQAGPFSETRARSICDAIKAQKPGGCLVVRK